MTCWGCTISKMAELGIQTQVGSIRSPRQSQGWVWKLGWGSGFVCFGHWTPFFSPPTHTCSCRPPHLWSRTEGLSHLPFPPWCEDSQLFVLSQGQPIKGSDPFYFLSREVAQLCGNHQFKGNEFSCPPQLAAGGGQGPVSQRRQAQLHRAFVRGWPQARGHSSVEAARPLY